MRDTAREKRAIACSPDDIPLLVTPNRFVPPVSAAQPRAIYLFERVSAGAEVNLPWAATAHFDGSTFGGAQDTQAESRRRIRHSRQCRRNAKWFHMKVTRPPSVIKHRLTDVAFTHNRRDLPQRPRLFRLWKDLSEA